MRKLQMTFKEGVEAGNTGRPMTVTLVLDNEALVDELVKAAAAVKIQAKTRKKTVGWLYEDLDGAEVKVSQVMARTAATVTPQGAVTVLNSLPMAQRIEMLLQMMNVDGVQKYLDHQLEIGNITEDQHEEGCDILTMQD